METKEGASREPELISLEFSEPVHKYESTARYTNSEGQTFELRIRGEKLYKIRQYIRNVRVSFKVAPPAVYISTDQESSAEQDAEYRNLVETTYKEIELKPELDLHIDVEIVDPKGMEPPYIFNFGIDPPIDGGATHYYYAKVRSKSIKVNLSASENGVSGYLSGGDDPVRDQADTFAPDPPKKSAKFIGRSGSPTWFSFSVTGISPKNKYSVHSSVAWERD